MKPTFTDYLINENKELDEGILTQMTMDLLPSKVIAWLKDKLHGPKYDEVMKTFHQVMNSRDISAKQALVVAAGVHNISFRDVQHLLDEPNVR